MNLAVQIIHQVYLIVKFARYSRYVKCENRESKNKIGWNETKRWDWNHCIHANHVMRICDIVSSDVSSVSWIIIIFSYCIAVGFWCIFKILLARNSLAVAFKGCRICKLLYQWKLNSHPHLTLSPALWTQYKCGLLQLRIWLSHQFKYK